MYRSVNIRVIPTISVCMNEGIPFNCQERSFNLFVTFPREFMQNLCSLSEEVELVSYEEPCTW